MGFRLEKALNDGITAIQHYPCENSSQSDLNPKIERKKFPMLQRDSNPLPFGLESSALPLSDGFTGLVLQLAQHFF